MTSALFFQGSLILPKSTCADLLTLGTTRRKHAKGGKDVKKAAAEEGEGEEEEKDPEALLLKEMEDIKEGMEKR